MKIYNKQITKNKMKIIVELEENEIKELKKGEPITVEIKTTFYNIASSKFNQLNKEIEGMKKKLKL